MHLEWGPDSLQVWEDFAHFAGIDEAGAAEVCPAKAEDSQGVADLAWNQSLGLSCCLDWSGILARSLEVDSDRERSSFALSAEPSAERPYRLHRIGEKRCALHCPPSFSGAGVFCFESVAYVAEAPARFVAVAIVKPVEGWSWI